MKPALQPSVLFVGNFMPASEGSRSLSLDLSHHLEAEGWHIIRVSTAVNRLVRLVDMLLAVYRQRHHFDVAHIDVFSGRAFLFSEAVSWLLHKLAKPYVLTLRGGLLPDFAERNPRRVRRLLVNAPLVTCPSAYLTSALSRFRPDIPCVPNPLALNRHQFRQRTSPLTRLVWLRAYHALYNPELAPQVLAALLPEFPALRLDMYGPDKGDGSLALTEARVQHLGVAASVNLHGWIAKSDVPSALAAGDIFLNTTDADNTPVSVIEAMASGLCVVSTNVGGIPYLIENGCDGILVPPRDCLAMAAAVRRLLDEPDLAARISANARRKAERYDWAAVLPHWRQIFHSLCFPTLTGHLHQYAD